MLVDAHEDRSFVTPSEYSVGRLLQLSDGGELPLHGSPVYQSCIGLTLSFPSCIVTGTVGQGTSNSKKGGPLPLSSTWFSVTFRWNGYYVFVPTYRLEWTKISALVLPSHIIVHSIALLCPGLAGFFATPLPNLSSRTVSRTPT